MASKLKNTLEDLDLTEDEVQRFTKAFKDEEFNKLFKEYADEISNPENRRRYEEEIARMEADRGMDVEFVHPKPGLVLKTTLDGKTKAFINIATNELVGKPSHQRANEQGKSGLIWSIPHLFSHPRDDLDKTKKECRVFDVVFHPDTYRMAESNARFRKLVEDTALDGIEKQFGVSLDKRNVRTPKMKYKGQPVATVIRKKKKETPEGDKKDKDKATNDILKDFPYPYKDKTSEELSKEMRDQVAEKKKESKEAEDMNKETHTVPKYNLKYSQDLQLDDFGTFGQPLNDLQARSRRPERVIVEIDLPLIRAAGSLDLDINERSLTVSSEKPAAYKLTVPFSYPVQEDGGNAKFDKKTRKLIVTLPIVPHKEPLQLINSNSISEENKINEGKSNQLVEELNPEREDANEMVRADEKVYEEVEENFAPEHDHYSVKIVSEFSEKTITSQSQSRVPECYVREDNEFLTLLFNARSVQKSSFRLSRDRENCYQFEFTSLGSGGWPIEFSFFVKIEYPGSPEISNFPFFERPHIIDTLVDNFVVRFSKRDEFHSRRSVVHHSLDFVQWSEVSQFEEESEKNEELKQNLQNLFEKVSISASSDKADYSTQYLSVSELSEKLVAIHLEEDDDGRTPATVDVPALSFETVEEVSENNLKAEKYETEEATSPTIEVVFREPPRPLHSILKKTSSQSSESQLGEARSDDDNCCGCRGHGSADDIRSLHKSVSFSGRPEVTNYSVGQPVCSLHNTLKNRRRKIKRREQRRRLSTGSRSNEEDDEVVAACMANKIGKQRHGEPRQRHYSDSILITDGQEFIESDDFSLQESNENLAEEFPQSGDQSEAPFETKKRRRRKKKEHQIDNNANHAQHEAHVEASKSTNEPKRTNVNWSDDATSKSSTEHRTKCAIELTNSTIYELDDD